MEGALLRRKSLLQGLVEELDTMRKRIVAEMMHLARKSGRRRKQLGAIVRGERPLRELAASRKEWIVDGVLHEGTLQNVLVCGEEVTSARDVVEKWGQRENCIVTVSHEELARSCGMKRVGSREMVGWVGLEVVEKDAWRWGRRVLVLDGIADPGNVGSLIRSAWVLDWDGVILVGDCASVLNPKVIASSLGASLALPSLTTPSYTQLPFPPNTHIITTPLTTSPSPPSLSSSPHLPPSTSHTLLVLGNEARGVDMRGLEIQAKASEADIHQTQIPMSTRRQIDSLNVAAAGAILLHTLRE